MIDLKPTHYICDNCDNNFYIVTHTKIKYSCPKCGQAYELIPTQYGAMQVMIGGDADIKHSSFKVLKGVG